MRFNYLLSLLLFAVASFANVPAAAGAGRNRPAGMVLIPAGSFLMGSPRIENKPLEAYPKGETPRHEVYLDAFLIDKYEVTNKEFAEFLDAEKHSAGFEEKREKWVVIRNDLEKQEKADWWPTEIERDGGSYRPVPGFERYPVLSVSWYAADAYCRWAGKRLPTEAEWEKAARGGPAKKDYPWGNEIPTGGVIFKRSWQNNAYPAPVGKVGNYYPNGYGLYDMAGNVSEWCSDWYDRDYYRRSSPSKDPRGPETGLQKVIRGGSWANTAPFLRVAYRNSSSPGSLQSGVGFRCVKGASE
ncbi:MAG: formylglycine-generating enzyme family protein [Nitrospiraceae bacterium]|nr:formylglycine-generating enzyme family protein [Nitrospiraceae bacterium]